MPELPEVETTVNSLNILNNKKVIKVDTFVSQLRNPIPHLKLKKIIGAKLKRSRRIGKYIILDLNNSYSLIFHLGMSGRLKIKHADNYVNKHDHVILSFNNKYYLVFNDPRKFGFIDISKTDKVESMKYISILGIDAINEKLSIEYLFENFCNSEVVIKQLLLNQHIVAGIGNIYASEILYDARISPLKKGKQLKKYQIGTILKSIRKILKKAIKQGGSSISDYVAPDGTLGNFQKNFKVYGKNGLKINGHDIKKTVLHGRSTFFCPKIQK